MRKSMSISSLLQSMTDQVITILAERWLSTTGMPQTTGVN
jgi:hypothetical protein